MDIIVYCVHGGLVGIGKSQRKKCRKHCEKNNILLPPIDVAIDIGGGHDHYQFLTIEVGPWRSTKCSFQRLTAPETAMNAIELSCKENVRCMDQAKVAPVVCHP